ncbi:MAG: transposase [Parachlamydiaceae bacterium]|nr:transposase [Parachlamydiaceae bacterium]
MAWENFKVEHQRLQIVLAYKENLSSMADICRRHGISRKTAYKWVHRFLEHGEDGLKDLSKAPHSPNQIYTNNQIERAIDLKLRRRRYGPKKILIKLKEQFPDEDWPCPTRLYEIYKDHHLVTSRRIRSRVPATAPLGNLINSNDTWAVDLKGWFLTGDGQRCEPLTITDSVSRYLIRCTHLNKHSVEYVWPIFDEAFREYGLPNRIRSDNGPPFGSTGVGRLTGLSVNLIKAGVTSEWIRPGHPEENGRHERFHLTLKQNVASPPKETLALQIQSMIQFQEEYNFDRPHEALNMKTPGNCYQASPRVWDGILRSPEYDTSTDVRKVCQSGCIWLNGQEHYIGQTLTGEYVALKRNENDELEVHYGPVYLGKLSDKGLARPKIKTRRQR